MPADHVMQFSEDELEAIRATQLNYPKQICARVVAECPDVHLAVQAIQAALGSTGKAQLGPLKCGVDDLLSDPAHYDAALVWMYQNSSQFQAKYFLDPLKITHGGSFLYARVGRALSRNADGSLKESKLLKKVLKNRYVCMTFLDSALHFNDTEALEVLMKLEAVTKHFKRSDLVERAQNAKAPIEMKEYLSEGSRTGSNALAALALGLRNDRVLTIPAEMITDAVIEHAYLIPGMFQSEACAHEIIGGKITALFGELRKKGADLYPVLAVERDGPYAWVDAVNRIPNPEEEFAEICEFALRCSPNQKAMAIGLLAGIEPVRLAAHPEGQKLLKTRFSALGDPADLAEIKSDKFATKAAIGVFEL
ncbi:hypothetical protein HNP46_005704 [Pseudomonas nitritireducens]|uniref:Uncharacterized protein n=1 Tax=Pseudomonas nitroreducens TaxID=46680 RepID=A0A7W7P504_PSENT|nr:hypothetical protein [Pseudomonas nitritireducens]MBB4866797.1 hypothetical protein [Pseudomonas nitritireducens]